MNVQAIILAGGKGTRMGENTLPKVLEHINGRPLIIYLLTEVNKLNLKLPPVIVVGFKSELVKSALGNKYSYALQEQQLGTAHAVACAKKLIAADNVLILYGDMPLITARSMRKLIDKHLETNATLTMFTATLSNSDYGRIVRNKQGLIERNVEFIDASDSEKMINEVNPCIYMVKTGWLWDNIDKIQKNKHGEYYLTDILSVAVLQGIVVQSINIDAKEVHGVNTQEQLKTAKEIFAYE